MLRRRRAARIATVAGLALALAVAGDTVRATGDEPTLGYSALRQNWDASEPALTALTVGAASFGQRWQTTLPGTSAATPNQVYAQPIAAGGAVVVASEDNTVASLDAATGAVRWSRNLGPGWTPTPTCGDLVPHIGITSTPVYDKATNTVYVIAKADDGRDALHPSIKVHALDAGTGTERPHWPLTVAGTSTSGGRTFDPATSNQRPALLLSGGALYFGTASHCDHGPFVGFVGRVALPTTSTASPSLSLWTTEENDPNGQAGIWQSGGGIMSDGLDASGRPRLFFATGNGLGGAPAAGPGTSPPAALSESVVRLSVAADGSMHAADFFSPSDNARLDEDDADLGSGAPAGLPDSFGSAAHPHLLVIAGKDGTVRLLDRDALGGVAQGPGGSDAVVASVRTHGVWGRSAVFDGGPGRHYVYLAPSTGPMQAFTVSPDAAGNPTLSSAASSTGTFGFGSGSPVVTSDGGDPTTALVWIVGCDGPGGSNARLQVYPAAPPANAPWTPLASYPLPTVAKFIQPATDGGRVYVGTRNGQVLSFGAPTPAPLTAAPTDFGQVAVGDTATRTVTVTATRTVTVQAPTGASGGASAGFSVGTPSRSLPTTLAAGDTLSAPVTFAPTAAGLTPGTITLGTSAGPVSISVRGTGTADGVVAAPTTLDLGQVAVGQAAGNGVTLTNTGTTATTVVAAPAVTGSAQFTLTGAPLVAGATIPAQGSVTLGVRFSPTATGDAAATLTLRTSSGDASVPLHATGYTGTPQLALSETSLDFGNVQPGASAVASFMVLDTGTASMQITKAAVPAAPFVVPRPIAEGQVVQPGGTVYAQVFATPLTAMPRTDVYSVSVGSTPGGASPPAGNSPQKVTLSVNTRPWSGAIVGRTGCLGVSGSQAAGSPAVLAACTGTSSAVFAQGAASSLRLGSAAGTLCLQTHGGGTTAGTAVEVGTCAAGGAAPTQRWRVDARGTLVNTASSLCLQAPASTGGTMVIASCTSVPSEQWDATALLSQRGAVSSGLGALGSYCLTDRGGSGTSGTPSELAPCAGGLGPSQVIAHVGRTLRVAGGCLTGSAKAGAGVVLGQCSGAATQVWTADGAGRLVSSAGQLCLTVPGNVTTRGTALITAACGSAAGQRWTLPDARTAA